MILLVILLIVVIAVCGFLVYAHTEEPISNKVDNFFNSHMIPGNPHPLPPPSTNYIDRDYLYAELYRDIVPNQSKALNHYRNIINHFANDPHPISTVENPGTILDRSLDYIVHNINIPDTGVPDGLYYYYDIFNPIGNIQIFPGYLDLINDIHDQYWTDHADSTNQEEYYDPEITSDAQNVHDDNVQKELIEKYNRIRLLSSGIAAPDIVDEILSSDRSMQDKEKMVQIVNYIRNGTSYVDNFRDYESNIFENAWGRIFEIDDPEKQKIVKDSFLTAVRESFNDEIDAPYCVTGRVSRILDSFTLVDPDPVISGVCLTDNIIRKEIFNRSYVILKEEVSKLPEDEQRVYSDITGDDDKKYDEVTDKLRESLRSRLVNEYFGWVKDEKLFKMIDEALHGV